MLRVGLDTGRQIGGTYGAYYVRLPSGIAEDRVATKKKKKIAITTVVPLTAAQQKYNKEIERRRKAALQELNRLPVATLIWGPAPSGTTPTAIARRLLRDRLIQDGHLAQFSEDLIDPASPFSIPAQQLTHVRAHDVTFSIPDSPGSIAEIHDFARIPDTSHKIVAFLNSAWNTGYANQSLVALRSSWSCGVEEYDSSMLPNCIVDRAVEMTRRIREVFFLAGRRV